MTIDDMLYKSGEEQPTPQENHADEIYLKATSAKKRPFWQNHKRAFSIVASCSVTFALIIAPLAIRFFQDIPDNNFGNDYNNATPPSDDYPNASPPAGVGGNEDNSSGSSRPDGVGSNGNVGEGSSEPSCPIDYTITASYEKDGNYYLEATIILNAINGITNLTFSQNEVLSGVYIGGNALSIVDNVYQYTVDRSKAITAYFELKVKPLDGERTQITTMRALYEGQVVGTMNIVCDYTY